MDPGGSNNYGSYPRPPPYHPGRRDPKNFVQIEDEPDELAGGPFASGHSRPPPAYELSSNSGGARDFGGSSSSRGSHWNQDMGGSGFYEERRPVGGAGGRGGYAPWYDVRSWRRRTWAILVGAVIVIVIIIAVAVSKVKKNNAYPDYSKLTYSLVDTYSGTGFFDNFDYFTGYDPTSGFVHYVPEAEATQLNLTYTSDTSAVLRVDTSVGPDSVPNASTGRFSVRVTSTKQYANGLFLFDVAHAPYGCGTWPAVWLTDPSNWPTNGEIDVMESTNQATSGNQMTLHTTDGCTMSGVRREMTGSSLNGNCWNGTDDNAGCGVSGSKSTSGAAFNAGGGGVMALEWRSAGIRMWQFARADVPADISGTGAPDPSTWGTALADFPDTDCSIGSHFTNQSIIVDIDLCGSLTNALYGSSGCPTNCTDLVANQPSAFTDAFWQFNSFKVYQAPNA